MTETFDLLRTATELVTRTRHGSPSMLMRRLNQDHGVRITFATANQLLDQMHERGIVGPRHGSMAREVLMEPEEAVGALKATTGGCPVATLRQ